jgi:hypothetical protein
MTKIPWWLAEIECRCERFRNYARVVQRDVRILGGQARARRCLNYLNYSIRKFQIQTVANLEDGFGIRFR